MKNLVYKIKHWISRYGPAEIYGTAGSMIFGYVGFRVSSNEIVASYSSVVGGDLGYYVYTIYQEYYEQRDLGKRGKKLRIGIIHDTIAEFGTGELLDSLIIRPFLIYQSTQYINNIGLALFIGNTLADIIFYIPTTYLYQISFIRDVDLRLRNLDINTKLISIYYKIFGIRSKISKSNIDTRNDI